MHQYSHLYEFLKEKRERKMNANCQNFPNMERKSECSTGSAESLRQDKPKEEHAKTHSN